jgi:glycopeptide antibiotics resistance protein
MHRDRDTDARSTGTGTGTGTDEDRDSARTAARWFLLLVLVYVGFIAAATLSVGAGAPSWAKGMDKLAGFARGRAVQLETAHDLRDIATNVLLFLPLGGLVALRLGALRRSPWSPWLLLGPAVSVALEIAQAFTDRWPDPVDVLTNTTGHLLGYALVFTAIGRFGLRPQVLLGLSAVHHDEKVRTVAGLSFLYVCGYAVLQLVPFDVTVSLGRIYAKLLARDDGPRIILDPLFHLREGGRGALALIYAAIGIIPAAALKAHLDALRGRQSLVAALWFGTVLATALELAQIFVLSRTVDVACVLLAPIAAALGWALAWGWERLQGDPAAAPAHGARERVYWLGLAALLYIGLLIALAWAPFDFEPELRNVTRKLREETNWVPFRTHFDLHSMIAARDLIEETVQLAPLGLLIALLFRHLGLRAPRWIALAVAAGVCAGVGAFLELGQAFFRGRVVDVTDVLLAGVGGLLGSALVRVLADSRRARGRAARSPRPE